MDTRHGTRPVWRVSRRCFLQAAAGAIGTRLPGAGAPLTFGAVTDLHYADRPPADSRHYRLALGKLQACVGLMNAEKVDFLIELGDFKDQAERPAEAGTLGYLRAIESVFTGFRGPRYHVLGNHDVDSITKPQFQSAIENTGIERARTWYSFNRGGLHFVVLDANFRKDMVPYSRGEYDWRDANVSPEQLDWLVRDLKNASAPTVVFVHQRLDEGGAESIGNRVEVRRILSGSGKVALVMQGHIHHGDYQRIDGIHFYTQVASIESDNPADATCTAVRVHPDGAVVITGWSRAVSREWPAANLASRFHPPG
ncbi:MAG: metallophosphoesterase [Bryobacterales bacterium]|nr:metallophosphoesterase [Bryobacterales bacterium]